MSVTPLRLCGCGQPGAPFTITDGEKKWHGYACDTCLEQTQATLAKHAPVFEAMLATGVPLEIADDTMTYLLNRLDP